jgi:hypothetical protein
MTREREYGHDTPLSQWIRANTLLDSTQYGLTLNDRDWVWHKYKAHIDGLGTRAVQLSMTFEEKCLGAMPSESQLETLFYDHQRLNTKRRLFSTMQKKRVSVWHFGVFIVSYPGLEINHDTILDWYAFVDDHGSMMKHQLPLQTFQEILRFNIRPDTLDKLSLRRHHKKQVLLVQESMPLGFLTDRIINKSS